jgi:mRNA-degrading endonuclease RelE of RelBE toxin-antitoxin system
VRIRYTKRAELSIERIDDRWRTHRLAAPDLFWTELLQTSPERGALYKTRKGNKVRRVLLPKTDYHVYFEIDSDADRIMILVVWGARRERGPKL